MSTLQDVEKANRAVKDLEIRLSTAEAQRQTLDKDIVTITVIEETLAENVCFLKRKKIVASAAEYKRVRQDLVIVRGKLAMLKIDRDNVNNAYVEIKNALNKAKDQYIIMAGSLGDNVLEVNFGKKN